MANRQLEALETKKNLMKVAKELISEKGLANTSIAEIIQKCGVANGTFYTYFKRKEDIVFALSETCIRRFWTGSESMKEPSWNDWSFS